MQTRTQLIREIMEVLGVLASGQDVSAEDSDTVNRRVTTTLELLAADGVISIGDSDEFEDATFLPLAQIIAERCCAPFGIAGQKRLELKADAESARAELRRINGARPTYEPLRSTYY